MDPGRAVMALESHWLPRVSGDGPTIYQCGYGELMAAPRERGWTPLDVTDFASEQGCPA